MITTIVVTLACGALCGALLGFPWATRLAWVAPLTLFPLFRAYRCYGPIRCAWLTLVFTAAQLLVGLHWIYAGAVTYQGTGAYYTAAIALLFECIPYAILGFVAQRFAKLPALQWSVAIAGVWTLCEYWRATSPLGVPYVQFGHGLIDTPFVGLARIGGTEALTFTSVFAAAALFELSRRTVEIRLVAWILCAAAVGVNAVASSVPPSAANGAASVTIFQYRQVNGDTLFQYLDALRTLQATQGFAVWPESDLDLSRGSALDAIRAAVRSKHLPLLAGGAVTDSSGLHDALVFFGRNGSVKGYYAKRQLIPFSEVLPLPALAHVLIPAPLVNDVANFSPGTGPVTFTTQNVVIGPLICYESAFPALARDDVRKGANLLVAASDDEWFSGASGFWELAQTARLSALETGTPMIVAGTVGPSGAIDGDGRWVGRLPIGLPIIGVFAPPAGHTTIYDAIGDRPSLLTLLALIALAWVAGRTADRAAPEIP